MCEFNPKNDSRRIDPCMIGLIKYLERQKIHVLACCCGHHKYQMTVVIKKKSGAILELIHHKYILREKRFYKKDKEGFYYIPEVKELRVK